MALPKQSQLFVQSLMAAGALSAKNTASLYNECGKSAVDHCGVTRQRSVDEDGSELDSVADPINRKLERFGLQLKTIYSPWENDRFWGVVNIANDPAARLANELSTNKLNFFFGIVNELLSAEEISVTYAQNTCLKYNMRVAEAGHALQKLQRDQWLKMHKREGRGTVVTFGVRSLLELPDVRSWAINRASCGSKRVVSDGAVDSQSDAQSSESSSADVA